MQVVAIGSRLLFGFLKFAVIAIEMKDQFWISCRIDRISASSQD
jgi:hypothetical protein